MEDAQLAKTKIVLIGAGSVCFGPSTVADIIRAGASLAGSTVVLVDVNEESLAAVTALARKMVAETGAELTIEAAADRREALSGAEFVVVSIAVDRDETWKLDFEIPLRHGVRHVLGENGGPGAFFHCARNIPIILGICRDMEELCPEALLINFTNPEPRICLAINRYSRIRAVGLCHQIGEGYRIVARIMGCAEDEIDLKAAGINHFTWIQDMRWAKSGEDMYPEFRRRIARHDPADEPLSRALMDIFGLFPATGDGHAGEYVPYAWEYVGTKGFDFEGFAAWRAGLWKDVRDVNSGRAPVQKCLAWGGGERVVPIITGMLANTNQYELSVDIPNRGNISNLPDGPIVEVPGVVGAQGVRGLAVGPLPEGIAALCRVQMELQSMAVDAAVRGDRALALQTLVLDPVMPNPETARKILDELLLAHRRYLPQFA